MVRNKMLEQKRERLKFVKVRSVSGDIDNAIKQALFTSEQSNFL